MHCSAYVPLLLTAYFPPSSLPFLTAFSSPTLESMLEQFPFRIRGFHSDNGSEFINHTVKSLLNLKTAVSR